ncbi:MAG: hypothetical protein PVG14_17330 [Anaerolineales bacterium]
MSLAVDYLLGDSAPCAFASLVTLPLLVYWLDGRTVAYWLAGSMLLLTVVKRLEANRRPLPPCGAERSAAAPLVLRPRHRLPSRLDQSPIRLSVI